MSILRSHIDDRALHRGPPATAIWLLVGLIVVATVLALVDLLVRVS